jgi:hypothetical protein
MKQTLIKWLLRMLGFSITAKDIVIKKKDRGLVVSKLLASNEIRHSDFDWQIIWRNPEFYGNHDYRNRLVDNDKRRLFEIQQGPMFARVEFAVNKYPDLEKALSELKQTT